MRGKALSLVLLFSAMMLVLSACGSSDSNAQGQMNNNENAQSTQPADQDHSKGSDKAQGNQGTDQNKNSKKSDDGSMKMTDQTDDQSNTKSDKKSDGSSSQMEGTSDSRNSNDDHVLNVTAHNFAFNKDKFIVKSGKITIHFKSVQGTHGFALYKSDHDFDKIVNIVGKGTKTVTLKPGKYYIHCSVVCGEGHGDMDATLIVK